ncbi:hypothetical protein BASA60_006741 [Batrachochytrium salamandrivorans]|nr:hypothetical protein BASA60_006741 [Batrachochytrium salamandrivorans]
MSSNSDFDAGMDSDDYMPVKKSVTKKADASSGAVVPKPKKNYAIKSSVIGAAAAAAEEDVASTSAWSPSAPPAKKRTPIKGGKSIEEIYQKKTQLEHILIRPDTYIGSIEQISMPLWVFEGERMVYRNVSFVPGLYKIFDEIIVNAADNKVRDSTMDTIKISIDRSTDTISVYNNGRGIPIEIHSKEKIYVPELIFGHLLTSSNYDDDEKKVTGGRNGYGAKLCNIFSFLFIVETADSRSGKKFKQEFTNNMSSKSVPIITQNTKGEDYTRITFRPDLPKFKMEKIDDDFEALLQKRAYDLAGCVRGIKVYLNDVRIKVKDFKGYVDLYLDAVNPETGVKPPIIYERINDRWEVAYTHSDGQFSQVSFANSICTSKGGTHVNMIADQITSTLVEAVKKKDKKGVPLKPHQARSHLWVFVNCQVENPTFDSQTKETLTLRASAFGSKALISEDFMKKVCKSGIIETILSFAKFKQDQLLKKTDGQGKKSRISGITKLDDANNAGTRNGSKCTLILTEGDSAKSLAVSGLSVVGRDNFGVFPLRGKLLNVREATHSQITGNAEINAIKQILGLQHGKVYDDASSLRYGHLMIMTDQDHDGSHIKGLIINFMDHFWPSLLRIPGFLLEFITPIRNDGGRGWTTKYFKGLGTSTTADAKEYFSDMNKHLKPFKTLDDESRDLIDMAFNKKKADSRKEWLGRFLPGTYMDHSVAQISLPDFINHELILFSMADNARSIPSCVDGFKPGQRKILFACFKRNLRNEIKVAQLAGYVAEHSAYHHGEQSLNATIVNMAQNFIGSNNLGVLEPLGQFGTRLQGGKDAASPRYIFTNLSPLARAVFNPSDDPLLTYLVDDGQNIEPEWYLPILPMLLVNGADGIGTGWSSSVPNYNPRDIVECLHCLMRGEDLPEFKPWYRGFNGTIEKETADRYRVVGTIRKLSTTTVEISELPIRTWTQSYKEQLEIWLNGDEKQTAWIKDYKEYHTDSKVHFVVTLTEQALKSAEEEGLEKKFKLIGTVSVSNLVCFDIEGRIKKYEGVTDIIRDFYDLRLGYYQKRKDYMLSQLTFDYERLESKVRFVTEIITGKLIVQNRKRADLLKDLVARKYKLIPKKKNTASASSGVEVLDDAHDADEDADGDGSVDDPRQGYDYLLSMPIWNLTWEKVQLLQKEMHQREEEIKVLIGRTIYDLWRSDLDGFLAQWDLHESALETLESYRPDNGATAMGGLTKKPLSASSSSAAAKKAMAAIARKAKKVAVSQRDGEEDIFDDMDDDDFVPTKKEATQAASINLNKTAGLATVKTEAKPQPLISKFISKKAESGGLTGGALKRSSSSLESVTEDSVNTSLNQMARNSSTGAPKVEPDTEQALKRRFMGSKKTAPPTSKDMKNLGNSGTSKMTAIAIGTDTDLLAKDDIMNSDDDQMDLLMMQPAKISKTARPKAIPKATTKATTLSKQDSSRTLSIEVDSDNDAESADSYPKPGTSRPAAPTVVIVDKFKPRTKTKPTQSAARIVHSDDSEDAELGGGGGYKENSGSDDTFGEDSDTGIKGKPKAKAKAKPKVSKAVGAKSSGTITAKRAATAASKKTRPEAATSRKAMNLDSDTDSADLGHDTGKSGAAVSTVRTARAATRKVTSYRIVDDDESHASASD